MDCRPTGWEGSSDRERKREQFHLNIIGQSVTLDREQVRAGIDDLTRHFMVHGVADPLVAQQKAIAVIGALVRRQALILGFSDTFAVIGIVLAIAAIVLLFARNVQVGGGGGGVH